MFRNGERACVAVLAAASTVVLAQGPAPSKPTTFRSGVDLVVVEATVVDRSGNVARGLTAADFEVEIGGRVREIESADLVEYEAMAAGEPGWPDVTTNSDTASSRTILIVADQGSLGTESRAVMDAAKRWVGTLAAADRVGLVAIPPPGPRVEFTTDHAQVTAALAKVVPAGGVSPVLSSTRNVGLWEAMRIRDQDLFTRNLVIQRECRGTQDTLCPEEIDMTARDIVADARVRTEPTLAALRNLVHAMGALPGPKHVVLLSAGWPLDPVAMSAEIEPLAAAAGRANVMLHALLAERSGMDASVRRLSPSLMQDETLVRSSVETLSGWTGGQSTRVVGSGDGAFKLLSGVLAGYYRLAVRPAAGDLDGKMRRISVKVTRRGVSVRAHRRVMAASPASDPATSDPQVALTEAIRSNMPLTGLALRATSYVLHADQTAPDRLRLLVAGDVTGGSAGAATVRLTLFDADGQPVTGADYDLQIPAGEPALISAILSAPPDVYALRMAVRDAGGRVGSLHRNVDMRWRKVGPSLETTGLALFHADRTADAAPQPVIDVVRRDERLVAQVAFSPPARGSRDPAVVIEVTPEGASAPLVRRPTRLGLLGSGPQRLAQEIVPVSLLPPGRYTVAAIVASGVPPLTRTIEIVPEAVRGNAPVAAMSAPVGAAPSAQLNALALVKPAHFETSAVLDPAHVGPILEQLGQRVRDSAVSEALMRLRSGPWPTDPPSGPIVSAPLARHFVVGLGHLQAGDIEAAAGAFRTALQVAPDFIPAMAYLGACYAAGGKDKEAASAWQMALLRDRASDWIHRLAIEAWLRAGRPSAALALIKQARQRFPDDDAFVRLQMRADLADGRAREALAALESLKEPDETSVLMALATLYAAAREGKPIWDPERDVAAMRRWREVYAVAGGGSLSIVDRWIAEVSSERSPGR